MFIFFKNGTVAQCEKIKFDDDYEDIVLVAVDMDGDSYFIDFTTVKSIVGNHGQRVSRPFVELEDIAI